MSARAADTRAALREALAKDKRIHAWQVRSERRTERQTYLVRTQLESERTVEEGTHEVAVFVRNGDLLGRAAITVGEDQGGLAKRIDEAVFMAGLGGDAPWALPAGVTVPEVEEFDPTLDPASQADTSHELVERWQNALSGLEARPSSMELFCHSASVRFENSAGLEADWMESRVSMLTIVLASAGGHDAERQAWVERRRVQDMDMDAIVANAADDAVALTRATPPPSGTYPVVIDADEIGALLGPVRANASAQGLYQKVSRFQTSRPLPGTGDEGEPLSLFSNAIAPYGLSSYPLDPDGVPGRRVEIVKDGVFVRPWATKQYADYLGIEPTGTFANLEIPAGRTALDDLNAGDRVLYVRAFSWLNPDRGRGDFSSEVRVGRLWENGALRPVKGGSVSGNVFEALGRARYAGALVTRDNYIGPAAVRIEQLSVSGA